MLVLSRKRNEKIICSNGMVITIVEVRGDKVRIGIEAPLNIKVYRSEVLEAIEAEKKGAANDA